MFGFAWFCIDYECALGVWVIIDYECTLGVEIYEQLCLWCSNIAMSVNNARKLL